MSKDEIDDMEMRNKNREAREAEEQEREKEQEKIQEESTRREMKRMKEAEKKLDNGLPAMFMDKDKIATTLDSLKQLTSERIAQLNDIATMQVFKEIDARIKDRLNEIREASEAIHVKIKGHWTTIAPSMHIKNLQAKKISPNEAEITFAIYETNKDGNKVEYKNTAKKELQDGKVIEFTSSINYNPKYEVTEIIKKDLPITRKVIEIDMTSKQPSPEMVQ